MTTFLDPCCRDALLLLGAVHGLTLEQLTNGLQLLDQEAAELVADLLTAGLARMETASTYQRERYGAEAQALHLTPQGRQLWKRLVNDHQIERKRRWRERRAA